MSNDDLDPRFKKTRAPPLPKYRVRGTAAVRPPVELGHPARWDNWRHWRNVLLWQAVALALDIEPENSLAPDWTGGFRIGRDRLPSDYADRLEIACNHLESGELWSDDGAENTPCRKVELTTFGEWWEKRGWRLPPQFPRHHELSKATEPTPPSAAIVSRGRPKGSGTYGEADKPLLQEMHAIMLKNPGMSITSAAAQVVNRAAGGGSGDSKIKRLAKRYNTHFR